MDEIRANYQRFSAQPSDINEHLSTLREYSSSCEDICEMSYQDLPTPATWAFLSSPHKKIFCVTNKALDKEKLVDLGVDATTCDSVEFSLEKEVDLLFIDTWHVYAHLKRELAKHAPRVKKYIIMHDTTVDALHGESVRCSLDVDEQSLQSGYPSEEISKGLQPAIDEFLEDNSQWVVDRVWKNNNGLTVLRRSDVRAFTPNIQSKTRIL